MYWISLENNFKIGSRGYIKDGKICHKKNYNKILIPASFLAFRIKNKFTFGPVFLILDFVFQLFFFIFLITLHMGIKG